MNVTCPSCETVFRVNPDKVPEGGVRAQCANCESVFAVSRVVADEEPASVATPPQPLPDDGIDAEPAPVAPSPIPDPLSAIEAEPPASIDTPEPTTGTEPEDAKPRRFSRPFHRPADAGHAPEAIAQPERPTAPVFHPTPGMPVTSAPVPEPEPAPEPARSEPSTVAPIATGLDVPLAEATARPVSPTAPVPGAPAAPSGPETEPRRPVNPFLSRDPKQKARRLARALVSDMIVYQPKKRQDAVERGTLKEDFEDEIAKSWEEYTQQVGEELAKSTPYFTDALNEILAGGREVF